MTASLTNTLWYHAFAQTLEEDKLAVAKRGETGRQSRRLLQVDLDAGKGELNTCRQERQT
jgi:hypothetical protein